MADSGVSKVCHLTSVHRATDTRIFLKESRSLAAAGLGVTLVLPWHESTEIDGVKVAAVPVSKSRPHRWTSTISQLWQQAKQVNADLYHRHDSERFPLGMRIKRRLGAKVVYDSHEDLPPDILNKHWIPRRTSTDQLVGR